MTEVPEEELEGAILPSDGVINSAVSCTEAQESQGCMGSSGEAIECIYANSDSPKSYIQCNDAIAFVLDLLGPAWLLPSVFLVAQTFLLLHLTPTQRTTILIRNIPHPPQPADYRNQPTDPPPQGSKMSYNKPTSPPPSYQAPAYSGNFHQNASSPSPGAAQDYYSSPQPQGGYYQQPYGPQQGYGYPQQQGGYYGQGPMQYPQQQGYPPQQYQQRGHHSGGGSGAGGICAGIMAALACCCCLDILF
ncbi:hypothetical protein N7532_011362 [Penicillium argentinense]|uniref:Cysteine-rich transmembrane CYSTM domain-containing protein n=1 Tax=Penicillium argentinense TaxID=1131581 RepID=A0A9W9JUF0_9EURO|nr:uncharacterized protein N7532_011362 [Penicillium argentinense]KAJ5082319.1 hypothetical protein N7532_011362 [Penicillium argentinense]